MRSGSFRKNGPKSKILIKYKHLSPLASPRGLFLFQKTQILEVVDIFDDLFMNFQKGEIGIIGKYENRG